MGIAGIAVRWGVLGTARIADAQVRAIGMTSNSELAAIASRNPNATFYNVMDYFIARRAALKGASHA